MKKSALGVLHIWSVNFGMKSCVQCKLTQFTQLIAMKQFINTLRDSIEITVPNSNVGRLARLKARRKLWLDVHLYLGLIVGAILAVVGLTGGILVFYQEMQEVLNPELAIVSTPPGSQERLHALEGIVAAAETVKPQGSVFFKVYYPPFNDRKIDAFI